MFSPAAAKRQAGRIKTAGLPFLSSNPGDRDLNNIILQSPISYRCPVLLLPFAPQVLQDGYYTENHNTGSASAHSPGLIRARAAKEENPFMNRQGKEKILDGSRQGHDTNTGTDDGNDCIDGRCINKEQIGTQGKI